ncbi:MAG: Ig-like domain-containing protein, partial [Tannerella sp.]|nr:Ig-like domain-containing protein [Tannerella sp.]
MNTDKIKLFAIALFAVALGTQSCSDETKDVRAEAIGLTPDNTVMLINTTTTLVAKVFPLEATDRGVIWTSDNPSVATVDGDGLVSALSEGTTIITATAASNEKREKTCTVTVIPTLGISLNANSLRIPVEATRTLAVTIVPDNLTQEVIWTSDNTSVATVDGGVVTAVAPGTAKITAVSVISDDRTAECAVTVVDVSSMPAGKWIAGMWTFEDADNPGRSTIGADLEASGDIAIISGPDGTGAVKPASNAYYTIRHNIGANGGDRVNEYTLMMDIRGTASEFAGWLSVYNTQSNNTGEGVLW